MKHRTRTEDKILVSSQSIVWYHLLHKKISSRAISITGAFTKYPRIFNEFQNYNIENVKNLEMAA